jgi:hypothetical protein
MIVWCRSRCKFIGKYQPMSFGGKNMKGRREKRRKCDEKRREDKRQKGKLK